MPKPNPNSPSAVIDFEALPNPSAQDYYPKPKYLRIRSFGPFYPLSQPLKEPWCPGHPPRLGTRHIEAKYTALTLLECCVSRLHRQILVVPDRWDSKAVRL